MKTLIGLLGAASAFAFALPTPASATLQIAFSNSGGGSFFCADQTACDLDGAAKNLLLINTVIGNIKIEGTFAASATSPDTLTVSNLSFTNVGATSETLTMAVSDTGFTTPVTFINSSGSATFNDEVGATGTLSFFASHLNAQGAANSTDLPGTNLFTKTGIITANPDSFSGSVTTPFIQGIGAFSMSEGASINLLPGGEVVGFNQAMTGGIPELSTWAMLVGGFGLMSILGWRKSRSARFAF